EQLRDIGVLSHTAPQPTATRVPTPGRETTTALPPGRERIRSRMLIAIPRRASSTVARSKPRPSSMTVTSTRSTPRRTWTARDAGRHRRRVRHPLVTEGRRWIDLRRRCLHAPQPRAGVDRCRGRVDTPMLEIVERRERLARLARGVFVAPGRGEEGDENAVVH